MNFSRRSFLRTLPAAPIAAKVAAEEATRRLADVGVKLGQSSGASPPSGPYPKMAGNPDEPKPADYMRALRQPLLRGQIESALYEDERYVREIDHDLASKKSFSLAAKITFQRQRNVARSLQFMQREEAERPWRRIRAAVFEDGGGLLRGLIK